MTLIYSRKKNLFKRIYKLRESKSSQARIQHLKEVSHTDEMQCFLLFEILTCLTSYMYHYQSAGIRIRNMAPFLVATNWSVRIYRVGAQICYVSWKLNLCRKIQILNYWLTANYSKCITWGHSIITLPQNDQNLDTSSILICTCLILILYSDSHLF